MPRSFPLTLLCVFILLASVTGCEPETSSDTLSTGGQEDPSSTAATPGVPLTDILDAARGGDAEALLARLNEPQQIERDPQPNRHDPSQTDTLHTLHYEGLTLTVYDVSGDRSFIQYLRLTDERYETADGLHIGSTRAEVEAALGTPSEQDGETYTYELGEVTPNPLRITFDGDAVAQMDWSFYVD